jgi:uncharacterized protein YcfJ
MKNIRNLLAGMTLMMASTFASAGHYDNEYTYAPVVDVQPVYETIRVPQNRRVCEDRNRGSRGRSYGERRTSSGGGAVLGGIIGGLLGNRFGDGRGRDAATAVGIIAGAAIGSGADKSNRRYSNSRYSNRHNGRRQCYTQRDYYEEQRITGYDVAYEYIGRTYHTRMQNHPGDRVRIQVNVQVAEY